MPIRRSMLVAAAILCGCTSAVDRQTGETSAVKRQVSEEITRICRLPESQRQAEIERTQNEAGMKIVCPGR